MRGRHGGVLALEVLKLIGLLSSDAGVQGAIAKEFCSLRTCCIPRGILPLKAAVTCPDDCKTDWFKAVVLELACQMDIANFDQECNHAGMKVLLNTRRGKLYNFNHAAMMFMGHGVGVAHSAAIKSASQPQGRPQVGPRQKKRRRYDSWNAFVAEHKPATQRSEMGHAIKSGDHLRHLGVRWAGAWVLRPVRLLRVWISEGLTQADS